MRSATIALAVIPVILLGCVMVWAVVNTMLHPPCWERGADLATCKPRPCWETGACHP